MQSVRVRETLSAGSAVLLVLSGTGPVSRQPPGTRIARRRHGVRGLDSLGGGAPTTGRSRTAVRFPPRDVGADPDPPADERLQPPGLRHRPGSTRSPLTPSLTLIRQAPTRVATTALRRRKPSAPRRSASRRDTGRRRPSRARRVPPSPGCGCNGAAPRCAHRWRAPAPGWRVAWKEAPGDDEVDRCHARRHERRGTVEDVEALVLREAPEEEHRARFLGGRLPEPLLDQAVHAEMGSVDPFRSEPECWLTPAAVVRFNSR